MRRCQAPLNAAGWFYEPYAAQGAGHTVQRWDPLRHAVGIKCGNRGHYYLVGVCLMVGGGGGATLAKARGMGVLWLRWSWCCWCVVWVGGCSDGDKCICVRQSGRYGKVLVLYRGWCRDKHICVQQSSRYGKVEAALVVVMLEYHMRCGCVKNAT